MLKVENLSKHFLIQHNPLVRIKHRDHLIRAVDGVSLRLNRHDLIGLIGESGSGKTTLVKTIMGLYRPTSGGVYYEDRDIYSLNKAELMRFRRQVQMIFQDPDSTLDPRMTVKALLEEPLQIHRLGDRENRKQLVRRVMAQVNLAESFLGRYPSELSGGQRQRLAVARALLLEPQIIVADEPLAGLDNIISMQILKLLLDLKKELGLSYLLVSHDLDIVSSICNHIAVIYRGKIVESIDGERFEGKACHPYTEYLKNTPDFKPAVSPVRDLHHTAGDSSGGCSFAPYCPHRTNICTQNAPDLREIDQGHLVRCHLFR